MREESPAHSSLAAVGHESSDALDPVTVLVVEDSPTQAAWARRVLEGAGYTVLIAEDGTTGLTMMLDEHPAIVLADIDMPRLDGFELCRRAKEDPRSRSIPFVLVTHRDRATDIVRAIQAGADNYITKPLDPAVLTSRVSRILADIETWRERVVDRRIPPSMPPEETILSLERAQVIELLMGAAEKLENEIGAVSEIGLALTMRHDLDELLALLVQRARDFAEDGTVLVTLLGDDGVWVVKSAESPQPALARELTGVRITQSQAPAILEGMRRREAFHVRASDPAAPPSVRALLERYGLAEAYGWPMLADRELIGALVVVYPTHHSFSEDERRRFRHLADQAAVAVVNARLFEQERALRHQLEEAYRAEEDAHKNAMFMLAAAVEARDGLTGSHLRRVQAYAEALARTIGLPEDEVEVIGYSSIMHDVGKLLVPDDVLGKPGKLTEAEWVEMRRHPEHGARILGDREFFSVAREIARCHHERWDGSGYPAGLKGEAIPVAARLTSVADVFDALTTKRHYKEAWSDHDALAEIRRLSGLSFDPRIVDSFVGLWEGGEVARIRSSITDL